MELTKKGSHDGLRSPMIPQRDYGPDDWRPVVPPPRQAPPAAVSGHALRARWVVALSCPDDEALRLTRRQALRRLLPRSRT